MSTLALTRTSIALCLALAAGATTAATFTVTSTADTGAAGTLRWAIGQANGAGGADIIAFNIPGAGARIITLGSALPALSTPITIDGTTQPGYAGVPRIDVRGINVAADGFVVSGNNVQIKALAIHGFGGRGVVVSGANATLSGCYVGLYADGGTEGNTTGVWIENTGGHTIGPGNVISGNSVDGVRLNGAGATGITIKGNKIGTDPAGTLKVANAFNGIVLTGAMNNLIGGTTAADLNLVSGNTRNGVALAGGASGNLVERNYIGLAADGATYMGNGLAGVVILDSPGNSLGGTVAGTYNIIAQNGADGVQIKGAASSGNVVQRSIIGSDLFGTLAKGNGGAGVLIDGAPNNTIGGGAWGAGGNLISANFAGGVHITNTGATGNLVQGNRIGTDVNGTSALSSGTGAGVIIDAGASQNQIGASGAGNLLSGSSYPGVEIYAATQNRIYANLVGTDASGLVALPNQGAGIRLNDGAGGNDIGSADPAQRNVIAGNLGSGIYMSGFTPGASSNRVRGNWIGLGVDGRALGNTQSGVELHTGATGNSIGGAAAGEGNVISANGAHGVLLEGDFNLVHGNRIGTTIDGLGARGNGGNGVDVSYADGSQVGGSLVGQGNVISANTGNGVRLGYVFAGSRTVYGNFIGLDANGTAPLGNSANGILVDGRATNLIGGSGNARNVISANAGMGVRIDYSDTSTTRVTTLRNNRIGVRAYTNELLGNGSHGVGLLQDAGHHTIGGTGSSDGNVIMGNGGDGIHVAAAADNRILRNSVGSNGGLGIDLGPDGPTGNDGGDGDTGANNLQNMPVLASAVVDAGTLQVAGALNSIPGTGFRIEYFVSGACDATGYGEGEAYLGSTTVSTDGAGYAAVAASFPAVAIGQAITATATAGNGTGDTSELSNCAIASSPASVLSFASATASVAENGASVTLTVNRSGYLGDAVSVGYASANGSASAGADYTAVGGTLSFAANQSSATIVVPIADDGTYEGAETFSVALSGPSATAQIGAPASVTVTIDDNDPVPTLSVDNGGCTVTEGNSGSVNCDFVLRLSAATTGAVTFNTATVAGTATAGVDFTAHAATPRSIPAGQTALTVSVPVLGDALDEADETFTLAISGVSANAAPASLAATGTIADNDAAPDVSVDACSIAEGHSGVTACPFRIRLTAASGRTVTVNWAQLPTGNPALYDSFEQPDNGGGVSTVVAPQIFGPWTVDAGSIDLVHGDYWPAAVGSQSIDLSGGSAGTIHADFPVIAGQKYRVYFALAGNPGCGNAIKGIDVRWNGASLGVYAFDTTGHNNADLGWRFVEVATPPAVGSSARLSFVSLENSPCGPVLDDVGVFRDGFAMIPHDAPLTFGTATFSPGQTISAQLNAQVNGDTQVEPDEVLGLAITGGSNYGTATGATFTITNDDQMVDPVFASGFE